VSDPLAIAVVVPAWNAARYLGAALEGVLSQSRAPAEVVVVDDGSTDATGEVAAGFAARGVRLLRQANAGPSVARNTGVAATAAPLLAFLDADDLWPEGKLARQAADLEADPALDGVLGHAECFADAALSPEERRRLPTSEGVAPGWLVGSLLIRRDAFLRVGGFDPAVFYGQFIEWCGRARERGLRLEMRPEVALRRRLHLESITTRSRERDARMTREYLEIARAALARKRAGGAPPAT